MSFHPSALMEHSTSSKVWDDINFVFVLIRPILHLLISFLFFLLDGGVSIPCSYTSFLAPLSSSKLYNEVRGCRERDKDPECHFETPYVVRLHNFHQLADPKPCFTFIHPTTGMRSCRDRHIDDKKTNL